MLWFSDKSAIAVCVFALVFAQQVWAGGTDRPLHQKIQSDNDRLASRGLTLFKHYCAHCHGSQGEADGYNAEHLEKEPADLSDTRFISKKTNDQIFRVINQGGSGVKKSHLMPMFGQTLSEEEIWSLVAAVRLLAKDASQPVVLPDKASSDRPLPELDKNEIAALNLNEADREKGEHLFKNKKSCFACHELEEEGGEVGPDLSRAGFIYPVSWLYSWMRAPQLFTPESKMPDMHLTGDEARSLSAFLSGLKDEARNEEYQAILALKGDAERGRKLFFDPDGKVYCSKCHQVNGVGGKVGPDLSWIGAKRTRGFLLESILDPKAVITTGYSTVMVLTKKRKFITGVKKSEDDSSLTLVNKEGHEQTIAKKDIKKFKTQKVSTMPGNFKDLIEDKELADLLAFLEGLSHPLFKEQGND